MVLRSMAVLALLLTTSANALELAGRELFLPAAGRIPGAAGSFWQTDLVFTNLSVEYDKLRARVDFYADGGHETFEVELPSGESVVLEDFVRTKLGRESAFGTIHVTATPTDAQMSVQAVVHNTGGAEPLGQTVPALPLEELRTQSLVAGLLSSDGHRSNIGVANPHDEPVEVRVSQLNSPRVTTITVAPHTNVQLNAATIGRGPILFRASKPVYAYGSVIRGGGDPQFVLPADVRPTSSFVLQPACASPANLILSQGGAAPGWIVVYKNGVESDTETPLLIARYGITPRYVYSFALEGFAAELTPQQIAALRCEPTVSFIEQDQYGTIAGVSRSESMK